MVCTAYTICTPSVMYDITDGDAGALIQPTVFIVSCWPLTINAVHLGKALPVLMVCGPLWSFRNVLNSFEAMHHNSMTSIHTHNARPISGYLYVDSSDITLPD